MPAPWLRFESARTRFGRISDVPSSANPMNLSGSRAHRKPVAELIREWLEDQADGREAERRWKALKSGKTEAIPADDWLRLLRRLVQACNN